MKINKRFIAFLLIAGQLLSMVACSTGTAETNEVENISAEPETNLAEESTAETEEIYAMPEVDMDGWEMSVLNFNEKWLTWANTRILVDELNGDSLNDALYNRNTYLTETFDCKITVEEVDHTNGYIEKFVVAGDDTYDIYVRAEGTSIPGYLKYILDWNEIQQLQLEQPWWNPDATSIYNIAGTQVALAGNTTLSPISRAVCMVFNKNIWTQYGDSSTNLYELVVNNEWTMERFFALSEGIAKDLNGDGVMNREDLYCLNMGRGFKGYIASFLTGAGMDFTETDDAGNIVFTMHTNEKSLDIVTKLMDQLSSSGFYYNEDTTVDSFAPADFFKNSHALFTQGVPHDIYKLRDMEDDIGILPMPKYDETQEKYYSASWGGGIWTLAKVFNLEYAENLGILLDAMSYLTWRDVIPVYKEIALKGKTARDEESAAMLDIIFDSIYFSFGTNIMYDAILQQSILTELWQSKSSDTIVSSVKKNLRRIEKFIKEHHES